MKKIIPVLSVVILAGVVFYFFNSGTSLTPVTTTEPQATPPPAVPLPVANEQGLPDTTDLDSEEKPAVQVYKTAEEAIKAIKEGAVNYDDRILEQFTEVGEDCTWCTEVYAELKKMMMAADVSKEAKSFYAELLAVSGRLDNVQSLIEAIKNAPNQDIAEVFTQALELTIGKSEITQYLADQIPSSDESLKESIIAAVTNQGSRLAADVLYKQAVEKGDGDGYYSLGIGLGELVPDESAMPYLQELAQKRDATSHLAIKAMLNGGVEGLKLVMSSVTNSPNPEFDRKAVRDSFDHVVFDDESRAYLQKTAETQGDPLATELAKELLDKAKALDETGGTDETILGGEEGAPEEVPEIPGMTTAP